MSNKNIKNKKSFVYDWRQINFKVEALTFNQESLIDK